jgi:TonB family protein
MLRMKQSSLSIALFSFTLTASAQTDTPKQVSTADATSHLIHRVEPNVPPIAAMTKTGGVVKLKIVISPAGQVSSANVTSGSPLLATAASVAVKQWTFKPFLEGETPVAVSADVEVNFPGGMTNDEKSVRGQYFPLKDHCRKLLKDAKYVEAEAKCREAVDVSNNSPKDAVLERTNALSLLGNAIFSQRRFADAIPLYQQALELNKGFLKSNDADLATDYENLGRAYALTGNLAKADELYATSVATFKAAIQNLPSMSENYSRRLKRGLGEYAQINYAEGQKDAASALGQQADEIKP